MITFENDSKSRVLMCLLDGVARARLQRCVAVISICVIAV